MERADEDLTARARIRDAALAQFAEHGVQGATIRGIAEAAGVSAGLVQHHFGTKEALRAACDAHVIEFFRREKKRGYDDDAVSQPDFLASVSAASRPLVRYLARALVEGSPAAATLFDELVSVSEEFLAHTLPERFPARARRTRDQAAVMTAMHLGLVVLHAHLTRALGVDSASEAALPRVGGATLEIYAGHLLDKSLLRRIRTGLDTLQAAEKPRAKRAVKRKGGRP